MNIKFKHACLYKLALLTALLFVAVWFTLVSDLAFGQSEHGDLSYRSNPDTTGHFNPQRQATFIALDGEVDPYNQPLCDSLFLLPREGCLVWGKYFVSSERARMLIIP